jgi:hypothetical protein
MGRAPAIAIVDPVPSSGRKIARGKHWPLGDLGAGLPAEFHAYLPLVDRLAQGEPVDATVSSLVEEAIAVWARPGFDTFVSLPRLRFEPFDY